MVTRCLCFDSTRDEVLGIEPANDDEIINDDEWIYVDE